MIFQSTCRYVCNNTGLCGDIPAGVTPAAHSMVCLTALGGTLLGSDCPTLPPTGTGPTHGGQHARYSWKIFRICKWSNITIPDHCCYSVFIVFAQVFMTWLWLAPKIRMQESTIIILLTTAITRKRINDQDLQEYTHSYEQWFSDFFVTVCEELDQGPVIGTLQEVLTHIYTRFLLQSATGFTIHSLQILRVVILCVAFRDTNGEAALAPMC